MRPSRRLDKNAIEPWISGTKDGCQCVRKGLGHSRLSQSGLDRSRDTGQNRVVEVEGNRV